MAVLFGQIVVVFDFISFLWLNMFEYTFKLSFYGILL